MNGALKQAHEHLRQRNRALETMDEPLLPKIDFSIEEERYYNLINAWHSFQLLNDSNILIKDQIQFEEKVRLLFVEWFQMCRKCIVDNREHMKDILKDLELRHMVNEQVLAMIALSFIPTEMQLLSHILDRNTVENNTSFEQQKKVLRKNLIDSWNETKGLFHKSISLKAMDFKADSSYKSIMNNKQKNAIKLLIKFVSSSRTNYSHAGRTLADIESDLKNLLSNHPIYSVVYNALYGIDLFKLNIDIGQWLKIYIPQRILYENRKQAPLHETLISRVNNLLNKSMKLHMQELSEHESKQLSFPKAQLLGKYKLEYDYLDFINQDELLKAIQNHIAELQYSTQKNTLRERIKNALEKIADKEQNFPPKLQHSSNT
jgi:hypothetical protein